MAKSPSPSPTPSEDPDAPIDLVAFQTSLEDSLTAARSLVSSWIPQDLDGTWDDGTSAAAGLAALESRARPPRLGLGASASAVHAIEAEERKLRNQLLSHTKKHKASNDIEDPTPSTSGLKRKAGEQDDGASSDDDEEESRAGAIKRKFHGVASSTKGAILQKPTTTAFNPFIPPTPPSAKPIPSTSFYGGSTSSTSASNPALAGMRKNQRKKERERLKKIEAERAAMEEIRKEEQQGAGEESAEGEAESVASSSTLAPSVTNATTTASPLPKKKKLVKPPFAPIESSPSASPAPPSAVAKVDHAETQEDEDTEMGDLSVDLGASANGGGAGGDGEGKKKKRKKKRKSKGGEGEGGSKPLLNLGTL